MDFSQLSDEQLEQIAGAGPAPQSQDFSSLSDAELEAIVAQASPKQEKTNPLMSGMRNLIQGASGNFSDEIAGGVEAAGRAVGLEGLGHGSILDVKRSSDGPTLDWDVLRDAYRRARDNERADLKKDEKDNPGVSTATNIVGAVVSPINKVTKGMSLAKAGATYGGISALGGSESETLTGQAVDTLTGVTTGAVVGKTIDKGSKIASKVAGKVSEKASQLAEAFGARGVGAERGTIKKYGMDKVEDVARYAIDNGILSGNTKEMVSKNEAVKKAAMEVRDKAYTLVDEVAGPTFNPLNVAAKVEETVLKGKNRAHKDVQDTIKLLEPHLENIMSRGEGNVTLKEAQKLVESLRKKAKWDTSRTNEANEIANKVYMTVRNALNDASEEGAKKIGAKNVVEQIKKANKQYNLGSVAEDLLENKLAREQGNKLFGLTDTITGGAALGYGSMTGDWEKAAAIYGAKKVGEKYGPKVVAKTLDSVAKHFASKNVLAKLAKSNPAIIQTVAKSIANKSGGRPAVGTSTDGDSAIASLKGHDKWAVDGLGKISEVSDVAQSPETVEKLFSSKAGRDLLVRASDLDPKSPAMKKIIEKINAMKGGK